MPNQKSANDHILQTESQDTPAPGPSIATATRYIFPNWNLSQIQNQGLVHRISEQIKTQPETKNNQNHKKQLVITQTTRGWGSQKRNVVPLSPGREGYNPQKQPSRRWSSHTHKWQPSVLHKYLLGPGKSPWWCVSFGFTQVFVTFLF